MKRNTSLNLFTISGLILVLGILLANHYSSGASAQEPEINRVNATGTAFTYQGRLTDGESPADGKYDLLFVLFDSAKGDTRVGSSVVKENVIVVDGFFTVLLDFGDVFDGTSLWLEIGVRPGASTGRFTTLSPRQALTAVPYAVQAMHAQAEIEALEIRVAKLEYKLGLVSRSGSDLYLRGGNLHVVNNSGSTDGVVNGLGNIIIGYNEKRGTGDVRTGSHMLVVGKENNYSSFGGIVAGQFSSTSGEYSSVTGGYGNKAEGLHSSVSGGYINTASDGTTSILGGEGNIASAPSASVSGGRENVAGGSRSSVSGGWGHSAPGNYDWAAGDLFQPD